MNKEYSSPKLSFYDLIEIYPDAIPYIKKKLEKENKEYKKYLGSAFELKTKCNNILNKYCNDNNRWFWNEVIDTVIINPSVQDVEKLIKKNVFQLSALNPLTVDKRKITDQDIQRAKQIPIENFIQLDRNGFCICPFHKDTNKSFKVYSKTNTWYCFSENIGGDIIDLLCKQRNIKFIEAVKILIGK